MMLPHCDPVKLDNPGPCTVKVKTTAGPGSIDVLSAPGTPPLWTFPCPGDTSKLITHTGDLWVHYKQAPGGPDPITVDITQS